MDQWTINRLLETLIWLGFFGAILVSYYFYLRFRNKERMALIEKGADVSEIFKSRESFKFPWMRVALILIGIGTGIFITFLFIAFIAPNLGGRHQYDQIILVFSLLIFGGLSIILGNFLEKKQSSKNG